MSEEKTTLTVTIDDVQTQDQIAAVETAIEETLKLDDKEVKVKERKPRKSKEKKESKDANKTEKSVDAPLQEETGTETGTDGGSEATEEIIEETKKTKPEKSAKVSRQEKVESDRSKLLDLVRWRRMGRR